jgi:hypothetical protein
MARRQDIAKPPSYPDAHAAPFVYFDVIGAMGTMEGAIQIEVASRILRPVGDAVQIEFLTTARLRCSAVAAQHLRDALDKTLQMLSQAQGGPPVAASALN